MNITYGENKETNTQMSTWDTKWNFASSMHGQYFLLPELKPIKFD